MLEFVLFGIIGVGVGLRFSAIGAAMLGIVVIAGCVAFAIVMNSSLEARLVTAILSLLGFNLGLFWGLARDRRRGGIDTVPAKAAPASMSLAHPDPQA